MEEEKRKSKKGEEGKRRRRRAKGIEEGEGKGGLDWVFQKKKKKKSGVRLE